MTPSPTVERLSREVGSSADQSCQRRQLSHRNNRNHHFLKRVRNTQGLTLLEVMLALVFVTIALLAWSGLATVGIRGVSVGKKMTIATTLAQEKLEDVVASGYDPSLSGTATSMEFYGTIPEFPQYQRSLRITPHSPYSGMQTVTVSVAWEQGAHTMSFTTVLAE